MDYFHCSKNIKVYALTHFLAVSCVRTTWLSALDNVFSEIFLSTILLLHNLILSKFDVFFVDLGVITSFQVAIFSQPVWIPQKVMNIEVTLRPLVVSPKQSTLEIKLTLLNRYHSLSNKIQIENWILSKRLFRSSKLFCIFFIALFSNLGKNECLKA